VYMSTQPTRVTHRRQVVSVGFTAVAWVDAQQYSIDRHTWDVRLDQYVGAALVS